jgi:hypothetical protein
LPVAAVLTHLLAETASTALPHLAAGFHLLSSTAWQRAATDEERRWLIEDAVRRHGLKGTLAGLRQAAKDAGAELISAITPPAKLYLAKTLTVDERNNFVDRYPQLRIYRRRSNGSAGRTGFVCRHRWYFPANSDAAIRIMPQAFVWQDGIETELVSTEQPAGGGAEVMTARPGVARYAAFTGRSLACWPAKGDARARIHAMRINRGAIDQGQSLPRAILIAGLEPIDITPQLVSEKGTATTMIPGTAFAGAISSRNSGRGYLMPSSAGDRIYQKIALFDPAIAVKSRAVAMHLNHGLLGMPHHTAEIMVSIKGHMDTNRWCGPFVRGCLAARNHQALTDCLEAMRVYARAADRIGLNTNYYKIIKAGTQQIAGRGQTAGNLTINI